MAGEELIAAGATTQEARIKRMIAALLFVEQGNYAYNAFSAIMSSPWSTGKFSEDPEADAEARFYIHQSLAISSAFSIASSLIGRTLWPIAGQATVAGYMYWLYDRSLKRAKCRRGEGNSANPTARRRG